MTSKVNLAPSDQRNFSRRQMLARSGVAAATLTAAALSTAAPAYADTKKMSGRHLEGVFYDEGGAVFNVRAYGATGNGTSDDTSAIRSARAAASSAGGGIVYFPAGVYLVSSSIPVTTPGIIFEGVGQSATVITVSSSYPDGDVFAFSNLSSADPHHLGFTNQSAGGVRKLTITSSTNRTGGAAIHLASTSNVVIEDVDMSYQFIGINIDGTGVLQYINRGYYANFSNGGTGIWVNSFGVNDVYINRIIMNSGVTTPKAGLRITQTGAVWASACDFIHAENNFLVDTPPGGSITWCFLSDCAFDTGISRSMLILPEAGARVLGLTFVNCWASSAQTYDGCYIGGPVNGCEFIGHRFFTNKGNGLYVAGPVTNVHVDASIATGNQGGYGFLFGTTNFAVQGCQSGPYATLPGQSIGLGVLAGSNNYMITGNFLTGNSSSGLLDSGGPTKVVANNLV